MGYPLPPAPWNGQYRYLIVVIPDADEYARAAYDAYNQLSNAWAWGKEGIQPESYDAHQAWLQAIAETWRLLEMGWPDDMLAAVDEVESLLEALQFVAGCCDSTDPSGGTLYTDTVTDGVGDVPQNVIDAGYATGVSDWAGFDDYKCMIAHVVVDDLEAKMRKLAPYVDAAGKIVGGVATVVGIITTIFSGGLTALAGGILAVTGAASTIYGSVTSASALTALADDVAANHDQLACAFYASDGVDNAISNLNAEIDALFSAPEATLLKAFNYEPTARALYEGRYDAEDIAATLAANGYDVADYDCTCGIAYWDIDGADGTITAQGPGYVEVDAVLSGPNYKIYYLDAHSDPAHTNKVNVNVTNIILSGTTWPNVNFLELYDTANVRNYRGDQPNAEPTYPKTAHRLLMGESVPFSIRLEYEQV